MLQKNYHKVPILLIAFNRPLTTKKVLDSLTIYQPAILYVATDGPRDNNTKDFEQVTSVHNLIAEWHKYNSATVIKTLYQSKNLGCGLGVSSAISWFFDNEEMGIILEDDCVPHQQFFSFCEVLLPYYATNEKIFGIAGSNLQAGMNRGNASYYFSNYSVIWGWASWARAWKKYDYHLRDYNRFLEEKRIEKIFTNKKEQAFWLKILSRVTYFKTWDYQLLFAIWATESLFIIPNANLVDNIGFSTAGTHTLKEPSWYKKLISNNKQLSEITHPEKIEVNVEADRFLYSKAYNPKSFLGSLRKFFQK